MCPSKFLRLIRISVILAWGHPWRLINSGCLQLFEIRLWGTGSYPTGSLGDTVQSIMVTSLTSFVSRLSDKIGSNQATYTFKISEHLLCFKNLLRVFTYLAFFTTANKCICISKSYRGLITTIKENKPWRWMDTLQNPLLIFFFWVPKA